MIAVFFSCPKLYLLDLFKIIIVFLYILSVFNKDNLMYCSQLDCYSSCWAELLDSCTQLRCGRTVVSVW